MQYAIAAVAFAAAVHALPQGPVATGIPSDCKTSYDGTFEITVVNTTETDTKRSLEQRQSTALTLTLQNGVLKDAKGRIGSIVANHQFQFDPEVQTGAIYGAGWAVCPDGTLTIGGDDIFQQCLSGTFYNLYDDNTSPQCNNVKIYVMGASTGTAPAEQSGDGQPVQSQMPDGQITGSAAAAPPVTQITDGQIQAPVTQISDGQIQAPTGAPVTQITDGQIQAPVTQISDGQVQAPVTQISDGQVQAPTGAPVTQITDGQVQAPTGAPVTQITDGQIQAPTGAPVTQITDGQIQAPTNGSASSPSPSVMPYTGGAGVVRGSAFGLAAGVLAVALL